MCVGFVSSEFSGTGLSGTSDVFVLLNGNVFFLGIKIMIVCIQDDW